MKFINAEEINIRSRGWTGISGIENIHTAAR
jgi:hypothetical protein